MNPKLRSDAPDIIPLPAFWERPGGSFEWKKGGGRAEIYAGDGCGDTARALAELLGGITGEAWQVNCSAESPFRLEIAAGGGADESYILDAGQKQVKITAADSAGLFYGFQSLRQLLPETGRASASGGIRLDCIRIEDRPRFEWRGFMLDEGRNFHGPDRVRELLDVCAIHKINRFHWHLTEDQGWRMEIPAFPRLTEVGSFREDTLVGGPGSRTYAGEPHSGFYTVSEMRSIVEYAAERHITVVPEIEIPGHCSAALASYPELGCTGGPYTVKKGQGIYKDIYCCGKEETFRFLEQVLETVMDIFPSQYIHIGGDEAPGGRWMKCPDCRKRMKEEGLSDAAGLQEYFTRRVAAFITAHGRTPVGWNEILKGEGNIESSNAPSVKPVVQYWVGSKKPLLKHLKNGGTAVMSDFFYTYLDYSHCMHPLFKVYGYEPVPRGLESGYSGGITGIEAPLWTEWVRSKEDIYRQILPRLCAVSETAWSPAALKDYGSFRKRVDPFLARLESEGLYGWPAEDWDPPFVRRFFHRAGLFGRIFLSSFRNG